VPRASNQTVRPQGVRAGFPRSLRLLRHADFERVYKMGRRHFSASLTVFYLARQEGSAKPGVVPGLRVGFTVGRALGGAVERNRIRRRLREVVRLSGPPCGIAADVVMNPKKSLLTADFQAVLNEVRRAFVVIEEKLGGRSDLPITGAEKLQPEDRSSRSRKPGA